MVQSDPQNMPAVLLCRCSNILTVAHMFCGCMPPYRGRIKSTSRRIDYPYHASLPGCNRESCHALKGRLNGVVVCARRVGLRVDEWGSHYRVSIGQVGGREHNEVGRVDNLRQALLSRSHAVTPRAYAVHQQCGYGPWIG